MTQAPGVKDLDSEEFKDILRDSSMGIYDGNLAFSSFFTSPDLFLKILVSLTGVIEFQGQESLGAIIECDYKL